MAYVITSLCTHDYECVKVCPVDCIYEDGGNNTQLIVDPEACIDCGACVPVCPVEAIFPLDEVPAPMHAAIEFNAAPFRSGVPPPVAVVSA